MARKIELFEKDNFKSAELFANVLRIAPAGMTLDVMKSRSDIMGNLEKANGSIILEDAEWSILNDALKANKWPQVHDEILEACDAVAEAETVKVVEDEAG